MIADFTKPQRERRMTTNNKKIRIAALLGDCSNPFWNEMEKEYDKLASDYGMNITACYAEPEKNPAAQAERLMSLLREDYQGIIINPISNRNLVDGIHQAQQTGVPVFDVGAKTDQSLVPSGPDSCYHPVKTVNFFQQGKQGAACLVDHLEPMGGGRVVVMPGRLQSAQSIGRSAGAMAILEKSPAFSVIKSEPADFDRSKAGNIAETLLKLNRDIVGFFCANDEMALGVADVVKKNSLAVKPAIVGVDGVAEAIDRVDSGDLLATVYFSAEAVGHVILGRVRSVLSDVPIKGETSVDSRVIIKNK